LSRNQIYAALVVGLFLVTPTQAQDSLDQELAEVESTDSADLAKASQNPVGDLVTLPFQNNTDFGVGPEDGTRNTLNIQPVFPVGISKSVNMINRLIVPVVSQPEFTPGEGRTFGLGNSSYTAFFSPKKPGKLIWGVGPVISIPTATDEALGGDQWAAGPSVVALTMPGQWVVGALVSNSWSISGSDDDGDINFFLSQVFASYNKPSGWYYTTSPIITANWEAESGERWTIPVGGGMGKVFNMGKQPVNASLQAFYNVEKPEFAADWQIRFQFILLFPK
jgi:hypothetical protein